MIVPLYWTHKLGFFEGAWATFVFRIIVITLPLSLIQVQYAPIPEITDGSSASECFPENLIIKNT